jgi:oligoendopeptidase F
MLKLADSLCVYVEQAAYARFELDVYNVPGEELTVEKVRQVYRKVLSDFGLLAYGRDQRDYVLIPHFFISAQYVISYVVSNDIAMQIYRKELDAAGAGLQIWQDTLATTQQGILGYVEEAGLEDPFAEGRAAKIRDMFKELLSGRFS